MSQAVLGEPIMKADLWGLLPNLKGAARLILMSPETIEAQIEARPEFIKADEFRQSITPEDGVNYDWVWEYAKEKFKRAEQIYKELDDKASDIIKYLGGGTGLLALATLANITPKHFYVILMAIPSFLLALISIALAARAREPNPFREPPKISSAFRFASHYKDDRVSKATFLGQWDLTCECLLLATAVKADRIALATKFYVWAIALLALPILAALGSIYRGL